jgi:Ankyrin repeats (3 copies)
MLSEWFRKKAQKISDALYGKKMDRSIAKLMAKRASDAAAAPAALFKAIETNDKTAFVDILLSYPEAPTWKNGTGKSANDMLSEGTLGPIRDEIAQQPTEFMSPVGRAVHFQNAGALEFLLACGASCEGKDENNSPAVSAAKWNDTACLAVLVKYGVDLNRLHGDSWDSTPLMAASYLGKCEALEFLLDHGAKPSVSTSTGKDALNVAAKWDSIKEPAKIREKIHGIINGHPAKMQAIYNASVRTGSAVNVPRTIKIKPQ